MKSGVVICTVALLYYLFCGSITSTVTNGLNDVVYLTTHFPLQKPLGVFVMLKGAGERHCATKCPIVSEL